MPERARARWQELTLGTSFIRITPLLLALLASSVDTASSQPTTTASSAPDTAEIRSMIDRVRDNAGSQWAQTVHFWCEAPRPNLPEDPAITPTEIFDGVYIIGNGGMVVYVLRTTAGLVMIDALGDTDGPTTDAQRAAQLLPGFARLGLDPSQVKFILVTHGHADHWGGARYFQERFGTKVYVSRADSELMQRPPGPNPITGAPPTSSPTPPPKVDGEIQDGKSITFGDLKVLPIALPGHTPGTMGFIFPVKDRGTNHVAALFGGVWLLPQLVSDDGLDTFLASAKKFAAAARRARVDVALQNHPLMLPLQQQLDRVAVREPGPHPFVVGRKGYQDFLGVLEGCTRVNIARRKR
jgi:metallo-beta-lactamase class B